jgi:hypothetical protein
VYVKNHPDKVAEAIDSKYVDFEGRRMTYVRWGTKVTGWSAINVYPWVVLVRTGKTLDELRQQLRTRG